MFYLNKFIFGDTSVENDQKDRAGEQLETQVVDDWVVVHPCGEGHRDDQEDVPEVPVINIESAESEPQAPEQVVDPATVVQTRSRLVHAVLTPGISTPEQLIKRMHSAQRNQCCKSKKMISNRRCEHQNKVYEYQGHSKANNRRNKRSRPSGFRSSRITQRIQ